MRPCWTFGLNVFTFTDMTTDTFRLLARYNRLTNQEMNSVLSQLSTDELSKDLGGFYPTILKLLDHLYLADLTWLIRFRNFHPFESLRSSVFDWPPSALEPIFTSYDQYEKSRKELDSMIEEFSRELTNDDLQGTLNYRNWAGQEQSMPVAGLVLHFFNHQTHHRGQIALYLDLLGKPNDFSNLNQKLTE